MPRSGAIDFNKVNVRWTGAGGTTDVMYVGSANRCDPSRGGWHYDVDPATGTPQPRAAVRSDLQSAEGQLPGAGRGGVRLRDQAVSARLFGLGSDRHDQRFGGCLVAHLRLEDIAGTDVVLRRGQHDAGGLAQ
jgi:hypothetical protein